MDTPFPLHELVMRAAEDGHEMAEDGHETAEDGHEMAEDGHEMAEDGHEMAEDGHEMAGPSPPYRKALSAWLLHLFAFTKA